MGVAPWVVDHAIGVAGIGFSFGYSRAEDERQILTGRQLASHPTDVLSRGGRLLLNVGPTAEGEIPELQQKSLQSLGRWTAEVAMSSGRRTRRPAARLDPRTNHRYVGSTRRTTLANQRSVYPADNSAPSVNFHRGRLGGRVGCSSPTPGGMRV